MVNNALTDFDRRITVARHPMPPAVMILKVICPIPDTKGSYRPNGISSVEKLIPGAIKLNARQKPQKRYHAKLGVIWTESIFKTASNINITVMEMYMDI